VAVMPPNFFTSPWQDSTISFMRASSTMSRA
jgi:hypothetical protein